MYKYIEICTNDGDYKLMSFLQEDGLEIMPDTSNLAYYSTGEKLEWVWDNGDWLYEKLYPCLKEWVENKQMVDGFADIASPKNSSDGYIPMADFEAVLELFEEAIKLGFNKKKEINEK